MKILASNLKVGDYFKYRETDEIEHYVQRVDNRNHRIYEIDSKLQTSSIPFSIYIEKLGWCENEED